MSKRAVFLLLTLAALMLLGQAVGPRSGPSARPRADGEALLSLLRNNAFRAADKLAAKKLADPARIVRAGIQGAGGPQTVNQVEGLAVRLGPLLYGSLEFNEFPMEALNAIPGRYAAGLLGNPLLWPYRVHMDFMNGRLILEKRLENSPPPV